ncbi:MAG: hypothetical protein RI947_1381 [Candidatus Parcubacteria bacterium]|jgi:hypothetical protein
MICIATMLLAKLFGIMRVSCRTCIGMTLIYLYSLTDIDSMAYKLQCRVYFK